MSATPITPKETVLGARTAKELLHSGHVRQISLQTAGGQVLIGAPVEIDVARTVPGVFRAPAWAAVCATTLVARLAGLRIVVEQVE